jgi:hypothetical protein
VRLTMMYVVCLPPVVSTTSKSQRLTGVRLGNRRTPETELTLSMMRPAGREQVKRIDVKIRYVNHSSSVLINSVVSVRTSKGKVWEFKSE